MGGILHELLTLVLQYGYPVVALAELVSSVGAPLPMSAILLLSGSLAAAGEFSLPVLFVLITLCGVVGDVIDYFIGRTLGEAVLETLMARSLVKRAAAERARRYLARWSGLSIFLARWLFTPLSSLVSLLSGIAAYPFKRFIVVDVAGEAFAAVLWVGIGYAVGASWTELSGYLTGFPGIATAVLVGLALVLAGAYGLMRRPRAATVSADDRSRCDPIS